MTKEELKKELIKQPLFKSNGTLNNVWIHFNINKYDLSFLEGDTLSEKLYLLFHKRTCCEVCGKPTEFINYTKGYKKACSPQCKGKLSRQGCKATEEEKLKRKQTCIQRYGVDNPKKINKDLLK